MTTPPHALLVLTDGDLPESANRTLRALIGLGTEVHLIDTKPVQDRARRPIAPDGALQHHLPERRPSTTFQRLAALLRTRRRGSPESDEDAAGSLAGILGQVIEVIALDIDEGQVNRVLGDDAADLPVTTSAAGHERLETIRQDREIVLLRDLDTLVRTREHRQVRDRASRLTSGASDQVRATVAVVLACVDLSDDGRTDADLTDLSTTALAAADDAWHRGRAEAALHTFSAVVRLLFHPVLHSEVAAPPLSVDPERFLAPLRRSEMFGAMTAPVPASERIVRPPTGGTDDGEDRQVLVLTGSYPRFAEPLLAALRIHPDTDVRGVSLGERDRIFSWLGVNTAALGLRLPAALSGSAPSIRAPKVTPEVFGGADVVVADWADRGAMWASTTVPAGVRLVVRLHGADVFSPWVQFIDWSRVDDAVFVSAPLRDLARAVIGDRLDQTRVHVVEHGVDAGGFERPTAAGRERVLGMIGWGRVVKDPLWTLDVLEELLQHQPDWRLLLVGHPLERDTDHRARAYGAELRRRLEGPLAPHIEHVPQTDDVPAQAARMGFVISSSLRESFHLGVVEGVLAGAVPVVRDWPAYQGRSGPRSLYPAEWVVDDATEAARRIRALADPDVRSGAAAVARGHAMESFSPEKFARRIRHVVLPP